MATYFSWIASPIGELLVTGDGKALTRLYMQTQKYGCQPQSNWRRDDALFKLARAQLGAYFAGQLRKFDLPLAPAGTEFQRTVWQALLDIPYGRTESYGTVARRIGAPKAPRAIGLANGHNPISIIIPCHRVIGADGSLTGYGGGIERKRWLLAHEARAGENEQPRSNSQFQLF
ncbi:MAG: methylated-DNA--[protein]-cysteine S-methyltransferase [Nevskiales bacterium]